MPPSKVRGPGAARWWGPAAEIPVEERGTSCLCLSLNLDLRGRRMEPRSCEACLTKGAPQSRPFQSGRPCLKRQERIYGLVHLWGSGEGRCQAQLDPGAHTKFPNVHVFLALRADFPWSLLILGLSLSLYVCVVASAAPGQNLPQRELLFPRVLPKDPWIWRGPRVQGKGMCPSAGPGPWPMRRARGLEEPSSRQG